GLIVFLQRLHPFAQGRTRRCPLHLGSRLLGLDQKMAEDRQLIGMRLHPLLAQVGDGSLVLQLGYPGLASLHGSVREGAMHVQGDFGTLAADLLGPAKQRAIIDQPILSGQFQNPQQLPQLPAHVLRCGLIADVQLGVTSLRPGTGELIAHLGQPAGDPVPGVMAEQALQQTGFHCQQQFLQLGAHELPRQRGTDPIAVIPPRVQLRHRPGLLKTGSLQRLAEEADGDDYGQAADTQRDNQRGRQVYFSINGGGYRYATVRRATQSKSGTPRGPDVAERQRFQNHPLPWRKRGWGRQPREFVEIEKNLKKYWLEGLTLPRAMPKMRATCSEQRTAKNAAGSQG